MSPDRKPQNGAEGPERPIPERFLRELFEKTQPDLEAKASESMPRDLDALFEKQTPDSIQHSEPQSRDAMAGLLENLFSHDLQQDSQMGSPAHLDAATASELDRRVAEGIAREKPQPVPISRAPQVLRAPRWAGWAAAGLMGMLYLWGQGYLSGDANGGKPLFVLVDVDQPLDTSMDPGAISLAAAGAIDFVDGGVRDFKERGIKEPGPMRPKKGGEE